MMLVDQFELTLTKWVWYPIEWVTLCLRVTELLAGTDAKLLAQSEQSYSQTQVQS